MEDNSAEVNNIVEKIIKTIHANDASQPPQFPSWTVSWGHNNSSTSDKSFSATWRISNVTVAKDIAEKCENDYHLQKIPYDGGLLQGVFFVFIYQK